MTNPEYEEVESRLRTAACPTCGNRKTEVGPGITAWGPASYRLFGQHYPCDCATQVELYRHYLLAHIPEEYMRLNAEDYFGDPRAWEQAEKYLANWDNYRWHGMGIEFYSRKQGTGKTMLATYIGRELIKRGERVYYEHFRDIVGLYQLPYEHRAAQEKRLKQTTVLILDEVVPPITVAQHDLFAVQFEELIRYRTNSNLVTIPTTNLEPHELDQYYPRTYSLLSAKQLRVKIAGDDARREGIWDINRELAENGEIRPIS